MRRISFCLCFAVLLPCLVHAKDKNKAQLPKLVVNATFVIVTPYSGEDIANPGVYLEDREAVIAVENAVKKWGRYKLAYRRQDADLILVVRTGRTADVTSGTGIHVGSQGPSPTAGPITAAEFGDPRDMIAVFQASQGIDSAPLWREFQADGLKGPTMPLFQDFKGKVEEAAKP